MRAFIGIVIQTLRATLRARVFHLLLLLVVLAVFALPWTVAGDGTAAGQMQITLTYSLGILTALISASTIWIAAASITREIEGYQMHLVLTTSTPRWRVWLGKWTGIFLMHAFLFSIGAAAIYGAVLWKVSDWRHELDRLNTLWTEVKNAGKPGDSAWEKEKRTARLDDLTNRMMTRATELGKLQGEILVGRREYKPLEVDVNRLAMEDYQRRLAGGKLDPGHNPTMVQGELLRQAKARVTECPSGATKFWQYPGVRGLTPDSKIFVRYRYYAGSTSRTEQKFTEGAWLVRDFKGGPDACSVLPQRSMSGAFHEFVIPGSMVSPTGTVEIAYANQGSAEQSVIFQTADGPTLLVPDASFTDNFLRVVLLVFMQLGFLTALGCCVGSALTTPVALFVAASYLVIGMSVQQALATQYKNDFGDYQYRGVVSPGLHLVARGVSAVVVSINDFDASSDLSKGRLVTGERLLLTWRDLIGLRTLPLVLLGMFFLTRRELGMVVRG